MLCVSDAFIQGMLTEFEKPISLLLCEINIYTKIVLKAYPLEAKTAPKTETRVYMFPGPY